MHAMRLLAFPWADASSSAAVDSFGADWMCIDELRDRAGCVWVSFEMRGVRYWGRVRREKIVLGLVVWNDGGVEGCRWVT